MDVKKLSDISLDAAGLVALADLTSVARRTALTGTSALLDCLIICPGLHRQQDAPKLNSGEYPICSAMTTSYVFRVENQATVAFLQKVGRAGQLTTLSVSSKANRQSLAMKGLRKIYDWQDASTVSTMCIFVCAALTVMTISFMIYLGDWWILLAVSVLIVARLINVIILRRRSVEGWKGEPEPNIKSDLIVLMSQDRWIRIQGDVNDVKAVTSGEWLREPTFSENGAVAFATLIVYLDAALAGNGSMKGKMLLLILLFGSAGLLGLCNEYTEILNMYGRSIKISRARSSYQRRLLLAEELIKETGRDDWAIKLGMVNTRSKHSVQKGSDSPIQLPDTSADTKEETKEQHVIKDL